MSLPPQNQSFLVCFLNNEAKTVIYQLFNASLYLKHKMPLMSVSRKLISCHDLILRCKHSMGNYTSLLWAHTIFYMKLPHSDPSTISTNSVALYNLKIKLYTT